MRVKMTIIKKAKIKEKAFYGRKNILYNKRKTTGA